MYQEYLNQLQISIAPLSSEALKELLNDDDKLDQRVDGVLEILKAQKDSLFSENRNKAERNIEKEPNIIELRGKVNGLLQEGKERCEAVNGKLAQIKEKSGNVSQETALALLQAAAAESEEESEGLVKKLTDNEIAIEGFIESFLTARKTMHLRKLKVEKMQELMRHSAAGQRSSISGGGGGGMPAYSNIPGASGFFPSSGGGYNANSNVPYPLGPIPQMPMMPMPPQRPY